MQWYYYALHFAGGVQLRRLRPGPDTTLHKRLGSAYSSPLIQSPDMSTS